jgi:hypothetical protein
VLSFMAWIILLAGQAPGRLGKRYRRLVARGKPGHQVVVASARERAAVVWASARRVTSAPEG